MKDGITYNELLYYAICYFVFCLVSEVGFDMKWNSTGMFLGLIILLSTIIVIRGEQKRKMKLGIY